MASVKEMTRKDGSRFFQISVSRGYGLTPYTMRFDWPKAKDGQPVARSTAEKKLAIAVADFSRKCEAGEVLTKKEKKKKEAEEAAIFAEKAAKAAEEAARAAAEAAKIKTVRQYADEVFMPTKETSISENGRANYRMYLDKHILPVIGDLLLIDITSAILQKLIIEYQRAGYKHASAVKLYNILNGLFDMAFMDDSIPISPMLNIFFDKNVAVSTCIICVLQSADPAS